MDDKLVSHHHPKREEERFFSYANIFDSERLAMVIRTMIFTPETFNEHISGFSLVFGNQQSSKKDILLVMFTVFFSQFL